MNWRLNLEINLRDTRSRIRGIFAELIKIGFPPRKGLRLNIRVSYHHKGLALKVVESVVCTVLEGLSQDQGPR